MLEQLRELVRWALGLGQDPQSLTVWEMSLRAVVIFLTGLALVRLGDKRLRGRHTAFDMLMAIIIGSVLSRAINGSAAFFPTLAAAAVLVALHWSIAALAFHIAGFGPLVKGNERLLVRDGEILWDQMRKAHISSHDLEQALRLQGRTARLDRIKLLYLERSGDLSIIPADSNPRVVEVAVKEGVQIVRIELS